MILNDNAVPGCCDDDEDNAVNVEGELPDMISALEGVHGKSDVVREVA